MIQEGTYGYGKQHYTNDPVRPAGYLVALQG